MTAVKYLDGRMAFPTVVWSLPGALVVEIVDLVGETITFYVRTKEWTEEVINTICPNAWNNE